MKLELIRNADNKIVGYKLLKEATDDTFAIEYVRDMIFFGMDEWELTYDGRTTDDNNNTVELRWATREHKRRKKEEDDAGYEMRRPLYGHIRQYEPDNRSIYGMPHEELVELAEKYGYKSS